MSQKYDYTNPNDFLSLSAANQLGASYGIAGGLSGLSSGANATYGGSSYETYSVSSGANVVTDVYSGDLGYSMEASSGTVNQIASDLLQMNNRTSTTVNTYQATSNATSNLSSVEAAILRSTVPIDINETEEITWNGQRGIWANKAEVINWRGVIPLNEYRINEDPNPEVITKKSQQQLVYQQEVAIRYLRPPTPPAPGEILIQQEVNTITPPAPPLIIRQQPPRPTTPQPLVVREAPPPPPAQVGR